MRQVVVYELLSLDGVAEDPDVFITGWDGMMDANLAAVIAEQDTVLLGRNTYEDWARFWPQSDIEPFATFINGVSKYVVTSSPLGVEWAKAIAVDRELVDFVRHLKEGPGGHIGVHGSIRVAQALLAAAVVDELHLVIAPKVVGRGRRLFEGLPPIEFQAVRTAASPSGHLLVDYRTMSGSPIQLDRASR